VRDRYIATIPALIHFQFRDIVGGVSVWPNPVIDMEPGTLEVAESREGATDGDLAGIAVASQDRNFKHTPT
jgi:hypothetical protein